MIIIESIIKTLIGLSFIGAGVFAFVAWRSVRGLK